MHSVARATGKSSFQSIKTTVHETVILSDAPAVVRFQISDRTDGRNSRESCPYRLPNVKNETSPGCPKPPWQGWQRQERQEHKENDTNPQRANPRLQTSGGCLGFRV